jgi:tetratricopeptide (TPR) repeat protein
LNTVVQRIGLPLIDGAARLRSDDAAGAVRALEPVAKYDLAYATFPALYPAYIRGLAYLQAGEAAAAAAEFQTILRYPGLVGRGVIGSLAMVHLGRAQRAMGDEPAALASYQAFLDLWRDADADIPVYRAARDEYLALRNRHATNEGRP